MKVATTTLHTILCLVSSLIGTICFAGTCNQAAFVPNSTNQGRINQARLEQGLVGNWNQSFNQKLITISDIDGNDWQYYAIEKKPDQPQGLILFLHGFPEFAYAWEEQIEYFGNTHHAVAIDLKGHHYSSSPDAVEEYDFIELGWEMGALIRCLGYNSATIVGHDFGGGIAWTMGMLYPEVVSGLVILSIPHPYLFGRALLNPASDQSNRSRYINYARGNSVADRLKFSKIIFSDMSIFDSGFYSGRRILRLVSENWIPNRRWKTMKHYYRAMPLPANERNYPAELNDTQRQMYSVKRPTVLLWGMNDPYFSTDVIEGTEQLVPDFELVTYENASHWLNHEAKDLNQRIEALLYKTH